jgi:IclR family transcriptional regulator, acetate operon repressor
MRDRTPQLSSFKRTLTMLEAVLEDCAENNVSGVARKLGVPVATAHRQVATLVAEGYLAPASYGRHVAGARLLRLLQKLDDKSVIANVAAPILNRLAKEVRSIVQLGTLENDMVTYRLKMGDRADTLFTKIGMQLEAYCSAVGKVLLAHLPPSARNSYLASGPFVPLTPHTIIDPERLSAELDQIREQGFAEDVGEILDGLLCMAVPVRNHNGHVVAAISATQEVQSPNRTLPESLLPMLQNAADQIETVAFAALRPGPIDYGGSSMRALT